MSEVRNLVIGCDGTWNEPQQTSEGNPVPTNVVKFLGAMKSLGNPKRKHYDKGVGTRAWEALPGGIYGYGLDKRILSGYRFLCNRFNDANFETRQNKVFIIGFSRGAYTARRLAGLIAHSGIPKDPEDTEVGWEIYQEKDLTSAKTLKDEGRFFDIPIEMVGVWDTVKATNDRDFHDRVLPENVLAGYHAMAIDERRKFFPVLRWDPDPRAHEMWFAGVHSDVGGGYLEQGLSDIALHWMIYRALQHGLQFKKRYLDEHVDPRPSAVIHNSYKGIWKPLGEKTRKILKTDLIHRSVAERLEKKPAYRPENLPQMPHYWPAENA